MKLRAAHTFAILSDQSNITHGCFHRHGGISPAPYDSLNVSFGVGDAEANVHHNRSLIKEALGCSTLVSAKQVHGDNVAVVANTHEDQELDGFDALITNEPGVALLVQQADCQAVLLYDPQNKAVANIHSGWRGSVANIIASTVATMEEAYNSDPAHLMAAISPALGPCCAEFVNYQAELPADFHLFEITTNHFDFPAISSLQLHQAGVRKEHIEVAQICTKCSDDWFSFRRNRQTGRFCSAIGLTP